MTGEEQAGSPGGVSITSVLVANRGEVARRVLHTCRDLGLATVAVYADPDAGAPHVAEADAAVRLPGDALADTYLAIDRLVDAALRSGADAVHPGYGFLAEHADFARAVQAAGLAWIGPPPEAVEAMGDKVAAKARMAAAGVPVLAELDPGAVTEADLPVMVKAAAGGGGRGMRVVAALADLPAALEAAAAEAGAAFGDPTVFCEPYVVAGHHVEVQVLADAHGTVWALGERECSIQRRHQKVLEETPSPLVARLEGLRDRLFEASVAAARAIAYEGAGTVEWLVDGEGRFWFLEVNTRLQVEHPVTECTTGIDLVAAQVAVAAGEPLPPEPPPPRGHAIEVRLTAEDPTVGWQPQRGTLHRLEVPGVSARFSPLDRPGIRLDSGVVDGAEVGTRYDPLLAKVIAWAPTRDEAARRLAGALARSRIHGLATNRDLLVRVLRHPAFLAGATDTGFLDRHGRHDDGRPDLLAPLADPAAVDLAAVAAALAASAANRAAAPVLGGLPSGWRNVVAHPQVKRFRPAGVAPGGPAAGAGEAGSDEDRAEERAPAEAGGGGAAGGIEVAYRFGRDGMVTLPDRDGVAVTSVTTDRVVLTTGGVARPFAVARYPELVCVDSPLGPVSLVPVSRFPEPEEVVAPGSLRAPLPGTVARLAVAEGDTVEAGQVLLWLEAMKMQHEVRAPVAGVVTALVVAGGDQVEVGAVLAVVTEAAG